MQFSGSEFSFAAGAISGSFLFFFSLGYGATRLRSIFARPSAWFEAIVALVTWAMSYKRAATA
jgi:L-lysine exporter family protein LysE/ArgO